MNEKYSRNLLKIAAAQICQTIGWHASQSSALEILQDLLEKYIVEMGRITHRYSEQFGRTDPNLDDLGLAMKDMSISVSDLQDYFANVEPVPLSEVAKYPIPREPSLNFLKPGSQEVLTRPVYVHEHLPPMNPLEEDVDVKMETDHGEQNSSNSSAPSSPTPRPAPVFKRPVDPLDVTKKSKPFADLPEEEEGPPLRELSSVIMTTSGYLSSSCEGKLPEAKMPSPFLEPDSDIPSTIDEPRTVKKLPMKKIIEGVKRIDKEETVKSKKELKKEEKERKKKKMLEDNTPAKGVKPPKQIRERKEPAEVKLFSEPDRIKLNIFKKIPKVKEEKEPEKEEVRVVESTVREDTPSERIPPTPVITKPPVVEEVPVREPSPHRMPVVAPTPPPPPRLPSPVVSPPAKRHKKERKEKVKIKRPKRRSPTPECSIVEGGLPQASEDSPKPFFPFAAPFPVPPAPGLIPPPIFQRLPFNLLGVSPMRPMLPPMPNLPIPPTMFMPPPPHQQLKHDTSPPKPPAPMKSPTQPPQVPLPVRERSATPPSLEDTLNMRGKDKKDKKDKEKRKKEKKKEKEDKKREKEEMEEKKDKSKDKDKKDKRKEKREKEREGSDAAVPKITFKFGPSSPSASSSEMPATPKLIIKTKEPSRPESAEPHARAPSPEIARFAALITRPPKPPKSTSPAKSGPSPVPQSGRSSPSKMPKKVDSLSFAKSPTPSTAGPSPLPVGAGSPIPPKKKEKDRSRDRTKNKHPPKHRKSSGSREREKGSSSPGAGGKGKKAGDVALITETVGSYYDEFGNKVWICPCCGRQDDGTPMIGCDECDDWYHWVCVGIQVPPEENEDWYCQRCIIKKQGTVSDKKKGKKSKK